MLFNVLLYLLYNVHGIKIFTVQLTTVYMLMTCILIAIYSTYPVNINVYDTVCVIYLYMLKMKYKGALHIVITTVLCMHFTLYVSCSF